MLRKQADIQAQTSLAFEELIATTLGKTCIPADKFFANFKPTESEIERIRIAMALDGEQYLRICAARVFIGCSAPHFANVLVTKTGELISIDHASGFFEKNDDIRELFYWAARNSVAFAALAGIASLDEDDINAAVDEIPLHSACGSTLGFSSYFCYRLQLWKHFYAQEIPDSAEMTAAPRPACWTLITLIDHSLVEGGAAALARSWK
jgi:hypothetical protein